DRASTCRRKNFRCRPLDEQLAFGYNGVTLPIQWKVLKRPEHLESRRRNAHRKWEARPDNPTPTAVRQSRWPVAGLGAHASPRAISGVPPESLFGEAPDTTREDAYARQTIAPTTPFLCVNR